MISLYSGTPGSGKSLHCASKILTRLNTLHLPCICNFQINTDLVKEKYRHNFVYVGNDSLHPDSLIEFSRLYFKDKKVKEDTILLVIDECQLIFNNREWNDGLRSKWVSFFTQHRKFGFAIILIAQFDRMIDRQIRSLIEYDYIHRKVSNFGIKGLLLSIWTGNKLFVAVQMWYPLKEKCGSEFFLFHKKYSKLYDSYTEFLKPEKNQKYLEVSWNEKIFNT